MAKSRKQRFLDIDGVDVPETQVSDANSQRARTYPTSAWTRKRTCKTDDGDNLSVTLSRNETRNENSEKLKIEKIVAKRSEAKRSRAEKKTERTRNREAAASRAPDEHVTFAPASDERERMVDVLGRRATDPERRTLSKRLGKEFLRIYRRHRHKVDPGWRMADKEAKDAETAARLCIMKGVTPSQLIEYWQGEIGNFTGMRFPTLHFLASAGNVDQVAVTKLAPARKRKRERVDAPEVHGYSGELDSRIRPGLSAAGHDLTGFSDRFLLTVQTTAQSVARGRTLFISSNIRPLVQWVVENIYAD